MPLHSRDQEFLQTQLKSLDMQKLRDMDFVVDENDRLVLSWVTSEVVDKQGELIPVTEFVEPRQELDGRSIMEVFMDRGGPTLDNHQAYHIGKFLAWTKAVNPETGKSSVLALRKIFNDFPTDDRVWKEVLSGERKGLSIGGKSGGKKLIIDRDSFKSRASLVKLAEMVEISDVYNPCNPGAYNIAANTLAKSEDPCPTCGVRKVYSTEDERSGKERCSHCEGTGNVEWRTERGSKSGRCPFCNGTGVSKGMDITSDRRIRCTGCGKEFDSLSQYSSHVSVEHSPNAWEAEEKSEGFITSGNQTYIKMTIPEGSSTKYSTDTNMSEQQNQTQPSAVVSKQDEMYNLLKSIDSRLTKLEEQAEDEKKPEDEKKNDEDPKDESKPKDELKSLVEKDGGEKTVLPESAGDKAAKPTPGAAGDVGGDKVSITQKQIEDIKKSVENDMRKKYGLGTPKPSVVQKGDERIGNDGSNEALKIAKGETPLTWAEANRLVKQTRQDMIERSVMAGRSV